MIERQEIYCHACNRYVQFDIDLELNGNHILDCPTCGHEHCRVVQDGRITGERWAQRNGPAFQVYTSSVSSSATSATTNTFQASATGGIFLAQSWMNTTSGTNTGTW